MRSTKQKPQIFREPVHARGPIRKAQRADVDGVFPLMPQQYYDLISRRRIIDGERRLMFAVFEDAIPSTYVMCMGAEIASTAQGI